MATVTVGVTGAAAINLLEQTWRPRLATQCNEEMRIVNDFDDGNDGIGQGVGGTLNIRKILRIPTTKVAAQAANDGAKNLTYTANLEVNIPVTPQFAYGAVEMSQMTLTRLLASPKLRAAYRQQIIAGIKTTMDADGGALVPSLSTIVKGGAAQNFDKAFLLDGIGSLIELCKDMYDPGAGGWAMLKYHPRQYKFVHAINEITNAEFRGGDEKPVRKGWVWEAYGLNLMETGSILTAAGVAHNLLHITPSHVLAYNAKPDFLPPQLFELVWRLIAFTEYLLGEVWDEYAGDLQTAA